MVEIRKTELFAKWLDNLRDVQAKIILLAGGDKSSQVADIKIALRLARNL